MKELTSEEYLGLKTLEKRLRSVFYRLNVPGTFEEFFQSFHEDYLRGTAQNQPLRYYAIDYIRRIYGKKGERQNLVHALSFDDSLDPPDADDEIPLYDIKDQISKMHGKFRVIAGLMLIHGLNEVEIGFLFDVTPSRICHHLSRMIENMNSNLPFGEECEGYTQLARVEKAAKLLGVSVLWLREQMGHKL